MQPVLTNHIQCSVSHFPGFSACIRGAVNNTHKLCAVASLSKECHMTCKRRQRVALLLGGQCCSLQYQRQSTEQFGTFCVQKSWGEYLVSRPYHLLLWLCRLGPFNAVISWHHLSDESVYKSLPLNRANVTSFRGPKEHRLAPHISQSVVKPR